MEKQLPKNWELIKLNEGVYYQEGPGLRKFQYSDKGIPFLNIRTIVNGNVNTSLCGFIDSKEVEDKYLHFLLNEGDIICSTSGTIGKTSIIKSIDLPLMLNTSIIRFRSKDEEIITQNFILYFLKSEWFFDQADEYSTGTAQKNLGPSHLDKFSFPLPPLAEQNRIVDKLDLLFAQLETIKTSMANIPLLLKDFRQQVLTQAVTGKLTEEWRKGKDLKGADKDFVNTTLNKENKILNQIHLKERRSKIKLNPITFINKNSLNWTAYTIESLCVAIVDCLHETATFSNEGYKLIDTNNIEPFKINFKKLRYVDDEVYKKWVSRLKPEYGDIAFTREGSIGNVLMIPENDKYCIGQRTMLFRFSKLMNDKFCELYMNSQAFKNQVNPHIKGVASQHVNIRDLRLLEIPVPHLEEQQEIVSRVESLFAKADTIEQQYKTLKASIDSLPQALLHKAFKGELTEQLDTDGDARELLQQIQELKNSTVKPKKATSKKVKKYTEGDGVLGMVAEPK